MKISNGKITISTIKKSEVGSWQKTVAKLEQTIKETNTALYGPKVSPEPQFVTPYYILAINTQTRAYLPIAEYTMDKKGYPVRVRWSNQESSC